MIFGYQLKALIVVARVIMRGFIGMIDKPFCCEECLHANYTTKRC